jgi:small GTP-binding protein
LIQKKICTIGAYAVGKTSLMSRFVHSRFSDNYLTTIGVKIDKKTVPVDGEEVTLMLWDLAGEDEFLPVRLSFLRGASGYLLVADRTRPATLDTALLIKKRVEDEIGDLPFVLVFNKSDLVEELLIGGREIAGLTAQGFACLETSARTGQGVEEAFLALTKMMRDRDRQVDQADNR